MWCNGSTLALGAWRAVQIGHLRPIKKYIKRKGIIMTTTKAWSNFKKSMVVVLVLVMVVTFYMTACSNSKNSISIDVENIPVGFTDTGYDVKNSQNRVYHIVADNNGWLYYCSDVEGNLTPVLNVIGTPTKDLTPFIEMQNN